MGKVFLLFLVVPAVELYLLMQIGERIGVLPTLAMLFATAMLGMSLARAEGLRVLRSFQEALALGKVPQEGVASGLLVLLGGALLVVPGVLTDMIGVLLLVPFTRRVFVHLLLSRMQHAIQHGNVRVMHTQVGMPGGPFPSGSSQWPPRGHGGGAAREIIDVEAEVVQPAEQTPVLPSDTDKGDGRAS